MLPKGTRKTVVSCAQQEAYYVLISHFGCLVLFPSLVIWCLDLIRKIRNILTVRLCRRKSTNEYLNQDVKQFEYFVSN